MIVDGGSTDATMAVCQDYPVALVHAPAGRGQQLAHGAEHAAGNIFLFLHADSRITPEHCRAVVDTLGQASVVAGGFYLKFNDTHHILKLAEQINKLRFKLTHIIYGDHGIFVRRETYGAVGGFSSQPLFEDIEFSRKLKKIGRVGLFAPPIVTSARRFRRGGVVKTYAKMALMHIAYWMGVSAGQLARWYEK